jgi:hemoglobin
MPFDQTLITRIAAVLPDGLVRYRQTPKFTKANVPEALLAAHSVKAGVWELLRVLRGRVRYCLDGEIPKARLVEQGGTAIIEPDVTHHVELLDDDSAFLVEFQRAKAAP